MASRRPIAAGAILRLIAVLLLTVSPPADARTGIAHAQALSRWSPHVREASVRFAVPEAWIWRVMRAESGGRTRLDGRAIISTAGAIGLMQLMPRTWAEMRELHGLGADPHDPHDNILAGAAYLRAMYDKFGYPGLFAAYNAGPKRYADHLATGRPLPSETVAYVAAVGGIPLQSAAASRNWVRKSGVLVALVGGPARTAGAAAPSRGQPMSLFVRLSTAPPTSE